MHKSEWAGNISLNILGNNFDNDKIYSLLILLKGKKKYEETHVSNSERGKDKSIDKSNSIIQLKKALTDDNRKS